MPQRPDPPSVEKSPSGADPLNAVFPREELEIDHMNLREKENANLRRGTTIRPG